jgi:hypothetical protein
MAWTASPDGCDEFDGPDGGRMRIVPPAPDAKYPHWKLQDQFNGKWENARNADSEAEARTLVEQISQHRVDVKTLGRTEIRIPYGKRVSTPWGNAQGGTSYADGIVSYHTAGHGGFKLDAKRNRQVHEAWRSKGGAYEEDCEYAVVVRTFPQFFTAYERKMADERLKSWIPHQFMAATGETVDPSESLKLREENHAREHTNDWMTISAITSDQEPGMVVVTATIGGKREFGQAKNFLVPAAEYDGRSNLAFVVDPARHAEHEPATGPRP